MHRWRPRMLDDIRDMLRLGEDVAGGHRMQEVGSQNLLHRRAVADEQPSVLDRDHRGAVALRPRRLRRQARRAAGCGEEHGDRHRGAYSVRHVASQREPSSRRDCRHPIHTTTRAAKPTDPPPRSDRFMTCTRGPSPAPPLESLVDPDMAGRKFSAILTAAFALLALSLGAQRAYI